MRVAMSSATKIKNQLKMEVGGGNLKRKFKGLTPATQSKSKRARVPQPRPNSREAKLPLTRMSIKSSSVRTMRRIQWLGVNRICLIVITNNSSKSRSKKVKKTCRGHALRLATRLSPLTIYKACKFKKNFKKTKAKIEGQWLSANLCTSL
jgi:hypothetical protein